MIVLRRWIALALTFVIATAAGAALIISTTQQFGAPVMEQMLGEMLVPVLSRRSSPAIARTGYRR